MAVAMLQPRTHLLDGAQIGAGTIQQGGDAFDGIHLGK